MATKLRSDFKICQLFFWKLIFLDILNFYSFDFQTNTFVQKQLPLLLTHCFPQLRHDRNK